MSSIRDELGNAYVAAKGGLVAVDLQDPAAALMAAEERREGEVWTVGSEAWSDWVRWFFSAGPHPVEVARRLVGGTAALAPWLVRDLPDREAAALAAGAPRAQAVRVLAGGKEKQVAAALAQVWRRERAVVRVGMGARSLGEMLAAERATGADRGRREEVLVAWLQRVWRSGPVVREALKVLFVHVRAVAADVAWNMSGEEVAVLFGQGRAAESARVRREYCRELERAGFRSVQARFQKSATACARFAEAQRGNRNRAKSFSS